MAQKRRAPVRQVYDETLGKRLARLRRERGLNQTQLAARLGVSQSNVSEYEHDRVRLHSDLIVTLTAILRVSADELLGIRPPSRRVPVRDRRLLQELSLVELLPKRDKDALLRTIRMYASKVRQDSPRAAAAAAK